MKQLLLGIVQREVEPLCLALLPAASEPGCASGLFLTQEGEESLVLFCLGFCFLEALKIPVILCSIMKTFLHLFNFGSLCTVHIFLENAFGRRWRVKGKTEWQIFFGRMLWVITKLQVDVRLCLQCWALWCTYNT